jgi:hypothetical protein
VGFSVGYNQFQNYSVMAGKVKTLTVPVTPGGKLFVNAADTLVQHKTVPASCHSPVSQEPTPPQEPAASTSNQSPATTATQSTSKQPIGPKVQTDYVGSVLPMWLSNLVAALWHSLLLAF